MTTQIEDVPALAKYATALKALGYSTSEQVAGAAQVAAADLARYLHVSAQTLQGVVETIPGHAEFSIAAPHRLKHALGVRLERIPHPLFALMAAPGAAVQLPPEVNLIAQMQPVRDQGSRGTCVAHASTAAAELYWKQQGRTVDLSRQFLYWDCKQHDGDPNDEGTWIAVAMARLVADGCCTETTWPYVMTEIPGNESQDPPPASAMAEAATFKVPQFHQISPTSVADIKAELAQNRCVAFSVPVFNSWYQNDEVTRTGEIVNPIPGEANVGGHAMCFVGYKDNPGDTASGGGRFYLRNSWDAQWATSSVLGTAGYGTIPYSYIASTGLEAYSVVGA